MTSQTETPEARSAHVALVALLLFVVTAASFWGAGSNDFVNYDDNDYITENPPVRDGLSAAGVSWAFREHHAANWHPLTWISHMIDCELFGLDAGKHHLVNVLMHSLNAVLLFVAMRALTRSFWPCMFVAAFFALHPLRVESVAWASERKDTLSTAFLFLTLWAYGRYARSERRAHFVWVALFMALGLLSKSMLVTLPFLLLVLDYWPLERLRPGDVRRRVIEKLPLLGLSVAVSIATVVTQRLGGTVRSTRELSLVDRVTNAFASYVTYLRQTLWPNDLTIYYPHPSLVSDGQLGLALAAGIALTAVTGGVVWAARRRPYLATGWFWYLGTLVPVIGLLQVGTQAHADRYTYVTVIGVTIMVAWALKDAIARWPAARIPVAAATAVALAACVMVTRAQVGHWRDSVSLFQRALDVTERNYVAHMQLGIALQQAGDQRGAGENFQKAIEYYPGYAKAHANLGGILHGHGRLRAAHDHFRTAVRLKSDLADGYNGLGAVFWSAGDLEEAARQYRRALEHHPDHHAAAYNLGDVLRQMGRVTDALAQFERALASKPDLQPAIQHRNRLRQREGELQRAERELRQTARARTGDPAPRRELGKTLEQLGRIDEAVAAYREVLGLTAGDAEASDRLGALLEESGDDAGAVATYREAVRLNQDRLDLALRLAWLLSTSTDASIRDGAEALAHARRSSQSGAGLVEALPVVAAALAETGAYEQAARTLQRVVQQVGPDRSFVFDDALEAYAARRPYRSPTGAERP